MTDEKIAKLQVATNEAEGALRVCEGVLVRAEQQLAAAKDKYRQLHMDDQQSIQLQDTELPELIETAMQAKNDYEAATVRLATNKRYLGMLLAKRAEEGTTQSAVNSSSPPSWRIFVWSSTSNSIEVSWL